MGISRRRGLPACHCRLGICLPCLARRRAGPDYARTPYGRCWHGWRGARRASGQGRASILRVSGWPRQAGYWACAALGHGACTGLAGGCACFTRWASRWSMCRPAGQKRRWRTAACAGGPSAWWRRRRPRSRRLRDGRTPCLQCWPKGSKRRWACRRGRRSAGLWHGRHVFGSPRPLSRRILTLQRTRSRCGAPGWIATLVGFPPQAWTYALSFP